MNRNEPETETDNLLSIGKIAALCNVTIRTLRYYDQIDLIKPDFINHENNYRFYKRDKITDIKFTQILKSMSFTLDETKRLLHYHTDMDIIYEMYKQKKREINKEIETLKNIKSSLTDKMQKLQLLLQSDYETPDEEPAVLLKEIPPVTAAFIRKKTGYDLESFAGHFEKVRNLVKEKNIQCTGYYYSILYDYPNFTKSALDIEIGVAVDDTLLGKDRCIRTRQPFFSAALLHFGSYETIPQTYEKLQKWIDQNKYKTAGPPLWLYVICFDVTPDANNFVTEVSIPIKK